MVAAFSYLYISQILRLRAINAYEDANQLTQHLRYAASNAVPDLGSTRVDTKSPAAVRAAITEYLQTDVNLNNMLQSVVALWPFIYDAAIVDVNGKALLHSNPRLVGKPVPERPDFLEVREARFRRQMQLVYGRQSLYDVSLPLQLNGARLGTIRVGVSTVFLKKELTPRLEHAVFVSIAAIFVSLLLSAGISNLALGPLRKISLNLDSVSAGEAEALSGDESEHDEYGLVTLKIANLGRQIRDSKEIFSALKDNVDQLMSNLQDGLMLFTRDFRVVLVSAPVEQFLGRPRRELLGRAAKEIFSRRFGSGDSCAGRF